VKSTDIAIVLIVLTAPGFALAAGWLWASFRTRNQFTARAVRHLSREDSAEERAAHDAMLRRIRRYFRNGKLNP